MGRTASEGKHLQLSNPKAVISAVHEGKLKNKIMTSGRCKRCSLSWGCCSEQLGVEGAYIKDQVILRAGGGALRRRGGDSIKVINDMSQSGPCRLDLQ